MIASVLAYLRQAINKIVHGVGYWVCGGIKEQLQEVYMIRAVIFDMDGVLIDSEIVYLDEMYKKLAVTHPWVKREDLFPIVGSTNRRTKEIVFEVAGEPMDSVSFNEEYKMLWESCNVSYPDILRKEAVPLLKALNEKGYLTALASSTDTKGIERVVTECGIKGYFRYIISGDMFRESKPNPEIYLHTAEKLGCMPSECFAVEDSTYGFTAGARAGMTVAAVRDDRFNFDQSLANYYIDTLDEVLPIVESLNMEEAAALGCRKCGKL